MNRTFSLHALNRLLPFRTIQRSISTSSTPSEPWSSYILKPRLPPNLNRPQPEHPQVRRLVFSLTKLLRHSAQRAGIRIRPDGYVPVRELLARPEYSRMKPSTFINLIQQDPRQRFQLKEEDGERPWSRSFGSKELLVRHHGRHSIKSVSAANKRVTLEMAQRMGIVTGVFCTDVQGWQAFRQYGIWSEEDNELIRLVLKVPENHGVDATDSQPVLISVNIQKALRDNIMFFKCADGSLVTEGDDRGCLRPEYFQEVVKIDWGRHVLHDQDSGA